MRLILETSFPDPMASRIFGSSCDGIGDFTGVLQVTGHMDGMSICERVPCGAPILVTDILLPVGVVSVYDFQQTAKDDMTYMKATPNSTWKPRTWTSHELSPQHLELCAGAGGMSIGAMFLGAIPVVSVDVCPLSTEHLEANPHGTVLRLDLTDPGSARSIHAALPATPGSTSFGFPCQPHSSQGLGLGSADKRHGVFLGSLHVAWMVQTHSLIVECVPAAGSNPEVLDGLNEWATAMGYDVLTVCLDLHHQWPCRRSRWWALALPREWNVYGLHPWPQVSPFRTIKDILSNWGSWSEADEDDLQLFDFELAAYCNPDYGSDPRLLMLEDVAATILHSYGNALTSCPCGCRAGPFASSSLRARGLRGFFVPSQVHGNPRYLHPREVAHLLGLPQSVEFPHAARASLALLGLVASPLQMLWVYAHLRVAHARANDLDPLPSPLEWLRAYQFEVLRQADPVFNCREMPQHIIELQDEQGSVLAIISPLACTVSQLLQAQRIILDWNESGGLDAQGVHLPLNTVLDSATGPFTISTAPGKTDRPRPAGLIALAILHHGEWLMEWVPAGDFVFQVLRKLGILWVNFLVDDAGKIYGADYRVWRSMKLTTLAPLAWPPSLDLTAAHCLAPSCGLTDKQVWWALQAFCSALGELGSPPPLTLHPGMLSRLLTGATPPGDLGARFLESDGTVICIFAADGHWALLWGQLLHEHLHWYYCDGIQGRLLTEAQQLAKILSVELSLDWTFSSFSLHTQDDPFSCGSVALLHVGSLLGLFGRVTTEVVFALHEWILRHAPVISTAPTLTCPGKAGSVYGCGPSTSDTQAQLAALLATKGVPLQLAPERASSAIAKLSSTAIQSALSQNNPWQALKALTTKPGQSFQFVLKTELQAFIDSKAASKFGAQLGTSKKKDKRSRGGGLVPLKLAPADLVIDSSHFVDYEGDAVTQIPLEEVVADARGLAISTLDEAIPYLAEVKNLSADALAILITEEVPVEKKGAADVSAIRFPVTYKPTNDPLLINGSILQLGDQPVSRRTADDQVQAMDIAQTAVLKIQVFRDELGQAWNGLCASPIRSLFQMVPLFRMCSLVTCDHRCGLFHPAVEDDMDQVVHEIWARRFQSLDGKTMPADKADVFQVFLRVAAPALPELLKVVAVGVYLEPRASGTKSTDTDYSVVWVPGANRDLVTHKLKTTTHGLSLVRMKNRFGIRVLATTEAAAYSELRPGDEFVKVDVIKTFRLHPLPHGLQRQQVVALLKEWQWTAKPLQPCRGSAEGGAWEVGAATDPSHNVMQAFGHDVLISLLKERRGYDVAPRVVGSSRAQKHLRSAAASSTSTPGTRKPTATDPWTLPGGDPWFKTASAVPASTAPAKRYDMITNKITQDLKQSLDNQMQDSGAVNSAQEARIGKLESDIAEIKTHQQTMHGWFQETGTRLAAQEDQMQVLQSNMHQTQMEVSAVHSEVQSSTEALQTSMSQAIGSVKSELSAEFQHSLASHMDRLGSMLSAHRGE